MNEVWVDGLVAIPLGFAVATRLLARRSTAALGAAVAGGLLTLVWSVLAVLALSSGVSGSTGSAGPAGVDRSWIASLGVRWHLGLDGISGPLVVMTTGVLLLCLVSLVRHPPMGGARADLAALLLVVEAGSLGSFLALDLVLFFVFFEVALIPMWFVITGWGDPHDRAGAVRAATRFLVLTVLGSALMLVGFLLVRSQTGTFDVVAIAAGYLPRGPVGAGAAVLIALGLAVKTPLWPLHIWLPEAHSKAPTVGSVVLAAVLLKLGTYGFVRFWLPVVDPSWRLVGPLVAGFAVVGILYASLACLAQTEIKRLIAYSSVGHMGFVVLAVATFTVGGVQAAVFASVAHGVITALLFFLAGAVKDRYGTGDLAELSALYGTVPRLAGLLAFAAMASLGLPGLAGFWGEMLSLRSALAPAPGLPEGTYLALALLAGLGVILTTAYFLRLIGAVLQGTPGSVAPVNAGVPSIELATAEVDPGTPMAGPVRVDVDRAEWLTWSPLVLATVLLGVVPGVLLTPVGEAATAFFGGLR